MKKWTLRLLVVAIVAGVLVPAMPLAGQGGYQLVVNSSNSTRTMTGKDVAALFLKRQAKWEDGTKAVPVDLLSSNSVRRSFTDDVHRRSVAAIKSYWQKMIFSGRTTPPTELKSDREVLAYVRRNPGAIGYVSAGAAVGSGVRVVQVRG